MPPTSGGRSVQTLAMTVTSVIIMLGLFLGFLTLLEYFDLLKQRQVSGVPGQPSSQTTVRVDGPVVSGESRTSAENRAQPRFPELEAEGEF